MANQEHLDILKQGVDVWNQWRKEHRDIQPDLSGADLSNADLNGADFVIACLRGANLREAHLRFADFRRADLNGAILQGADLRDADLKRADLSKTDLSGAILRRAILVETNFSEAILTHCSLYGISVWNVQLAGTIQENLVITSPDEPTITVDNLEVAQFIYLLLNNPKIRDVIDTIAKKAVLILGRFAPERRAVLEALREALRTHGYLPILFDFEKPSSRDFTETIRTLAYLSRFIIADLTEPSSIPQELQAIIPDLEVPVQPVLLEAKREYSMFVDFRKYHWVLPIYLYQDQASLMASLRNEIIEPAEKKARELTIEKAKRLERP
jgi:pentapeptide repeat protein